MANVPQHLDDQRLLTAELRDRHQLVKSRFESRNAMWLEERAILGQNYRQATPDYPQVMSPEPRANVRLALDITTTKDPRIAAVIDYQDAGEQDKLNLMERFAFGIYRAFDRAHRWTGGHSWLRDFMSFQFMGGHTVYPLVVPDRSGKGVIFRADLVDPLQVFPDYSYVADAQGPVFVSREYSTLGDDIKGRAMAMVRAGKSQWDKEVASTIVEKELANVVNIFWLQYSDDGTVDGVFNAVLVNNMLLKRPDPDKLDKQFGRRIPCIVGPATGTPFVDVATVAETQGSLTVDGTGNYHYTARNWESILTEGKQTYVDFDNFLSMQRKIVRDHALAQKIEHTVTGQPKYTQSQQRRAEVLTYRTNEGVEYSIPGTTPAERSVLFEYYINALQRTGFSHVAFGNLGVEISGVTLDSLINATQGRTAPFVDGAQVAIADTLMNLVDQYRLGTMPPVELETLKEVTAVGERWFIDNFDRSQLPKTSFIKVGLQLALPDTLIARINAAREAIGDRRPLASVANIHEKLLHDLVPDSNLENDRIDQDSLRASEVGQVLRTINGLLLERDAYQQRGEAELAQVTQTLIDGLLAQFQVQQAGAQQADANIERQRRLQGTPATSEAAPAQSPPERSGVTDEALAGSSALASLIQRRQGGQSG